MLPGDVLFYAPNSSVLCVKVQQPSTVETIVVTTKSTSLNPNASEFLSQSTYVYDAAQWNNVEAVTLDYSAKTPVDSAVAIEEISSDIKNAAADQSMGVSTDQEHVSVPVAEENAEQPLLNDSIERVEAVKRDEGTGGFIGNIPHDQLCSMLRAQLDYYFSRENLSHDTYLLSQMDSDHYVSIRIVAQFNQVRKLTTDLQLIVRVLRDLPSVQVDPSGEKVRPNHNRCILILREIPASTPPEQVKALFSGENCPAYVSCEFAANDCWYVTFDSDDDAQRAFQYLSEEVRTFLDKPIMARIKAKPLVRPTFYPRNGLKHNYEPLSYSTVNPAIAQPSASPSPHALTSPQPLPSPQSAPIYPTYSSPTALPNMPFVGANTQQPYPYPVMAWTTPSLWNPSMAFFYNDFQAESVKLNANATPQNYLPYSHNARYSNKMIRSTSNIESSNTSSQTSRSTPDVRNGSRERFLITSADSSSPTALNQPGVHNIHVDETFAIQNSYSHNHETGQPETMSIQTSHDSISQSTPSLGSDLISTTTHDASSSNMNTTSSSSAPSAHRHPDTRDNQLGHRPVNQIPRPPQRNYQSRRKRIDEDGTQNTKHSSSHPVRDNKIQHFELQQNSFPPLPGQMGEQTIAELRMENKMSDIVKGTVKLTLKDNVKKEGPIYPPVAPPTTITTPPTPPKDPNIHMNLKTVTPASPSITNNNNNNNITSVPGLPTPPNSPPNTSRSSPVACSETHPLEANLKEVKEQQSAVKSNVISDALTGEKPVKLSYAQMVRKPCEMSAAIPSENGTSSGERSDSDNGGSQLSCSDLQSSSKVKDVSDQFQRPQQCNNIAKQNPKDGGELKSRRAYSKRERQIDMERQCVK